MSEFGGTAGFGASARSAGKVAVVTASNVGGAKGESIVKTLNPRVDSRPRENSHGTGFLGSIVKNLFGAEQQKNMFSNIPSPSTDCLNSFTLNALFDMPKNDYCGTASGGARYGSSLGYIA